MTVAGLKRRSPSGALLAAAGTFLVARGVTGRCAVYQTLGVNSADGDRGELPIRVEDAVTIQRSARELYDFWRDFTNLPRIFDHLDSVQVLDRHRSHWVARGARGAKVEWDAEIVNAEDGALVAWRSLPGADVDHAGSVNFRPLAGDRGCEVRVVLRYNPSGGVLGAAVAKLLGDDPSEQLWRDLRRFKQLMEAAESPTTVGQPSGEA